jgi:hypothetical protein
MEITYDEIYAMCWKSLKKSMDRLKENPFTYEVWKTVDSVTSSIENTIWDEAQKKDAKIVKTKKEHFDGMRWSSLIKSLEEVKEKRPEEFEKHVKFFYNLMKNLESL